MRAWIWASLPLALVTAGLAQQESQPAQSAEQKIELTYSLNGKEMYETWCASCHGVSGKGDGPAAAALKTHPSDLTQLSKKNKGKFPTDRVRAFIEGKDVTAAHGSREMPVWGTVFQRIDMSPIAITYRVATLSSYVESLQAK